jgi:hypothetical protein
VEIQLRMSRNGRLLLLALAPILLTCAADEQKDPYTVLGVSRRASQVSL